MQQGSGRASPSNYGRRRCSREGREAPGCWVRLPSHPPLYIGTPRGGTGPRDGTSRGGAAKGVECPPRQVEAPPPLGFPTLGAWGPKGGRTSPPGDGSPPTSSHGALRDRWPHPVDPRDPSGGPGTIPVTPKLVPMAEIALPIYNSLPPDHSRTPRDIRDLIRDSEQLLVYCILISQQP